MSRRPAALHDADAFCQFYQRTHLMVYRFVYGMTGGPAQEVEDLTAEVFLRAWKARSRFSGEERAADGWIVQIARNLVIDAFRKRKAVHIQELPDELEVISSQASPEESLVLREQMQVLTSLLVHLPVDRREMVVLRFVLEWPINQIAEHLGLLENTVSVTLRRSLDRIREQWPGQ